MRVMPDRSRAARPERVMKSARPMQAPEPRAERAERPMRAMRESRMPQRQARPMRPQREMMKRSRPVDHDDQYGVRFERHFEAPVDDIQDANDFEWEYAAPSRGFSRTISRPDRAEVERPGAPDFDKEVRPIALDKQFRQPDFRYTAPQW